MKNKSFKAGLFFSLLALGACQTQRPADSATCAVVTPVWQSEAFALYTGCGVQGEHVARVIPANELTSGYKSPANAFQDPCIPFEFAINCRDKEISPVPITASTV